MAGSKIPDELLKWYASRRRLWWKRWWWLVVLLVALMGASMVVYVLGYGTYMPAVIAEAEAAAGPSGDGFCGDYIHWLMGQIQLIAGAIALFSIGGMLALFLNYIRSMQCWIGDAGSLPSEDLWLCEYRTTRHVAYWFTGFIVILQPVLMYLTTAISMLLVDFEIPSVVTNITTVSSLIVMALFYFLMAEMIVLVVMRMYRVLGVWLWGLMFVLIIFCRYLELRFVSYFAGPRFGPPAYATPLNFTWGLVPFAVLTLLVVWIFADLGKRPPKNWCGVV